jgi:hypothetical protein
MNDTKDTTNLSTSSKLEFGTEESHENGRAMNSMSRLWRNPMCQVIIPTGH